MVHKSTVSQSGGTPGSGTVTEIDTGTGLTGGPITSTGTISVASGTNNTLAGFNGSGTFSGVAVGTGLALSGGTLTATGGGGAVSSVTNSDGTLTISPTTGSVVASLNVGNANTWTAKQIFNSSSIQSGTLTASTALVSDASKNIISSATTAAELAFVSGVTSSIQTQLNAKQATGNYITALTGDGTASGPGSAALTLATVNSNVGSFGSSTSIPSFTVNAKGLMTAAAGNAVIAPAGTLTGATLASGVTTSSLTTVGTIATGTWNGTKIGLAFGGTNADLSATGGTSRVLKQTSAGATITVAQLAASDLSNGTTGTGAVVLASAISAGSILRTVGFSAVTPVTGQQGSYSVFPAAGSITAWNIVVDTGTATVKTWKIATGTAAPTSSNSINTSGVSISAGTVIRSTTLTDFTTTAVAANDIFAFEITAVSGATKILFELEITLS